MLHAYLQKQSNSDLYITKFIWSENNYMPCLIYSAPAAWNHMRQPVAEHLSFTNSIIIV